jgi:hypothetical protein
MYRKKYWGLSECISRWKFCNWQHICIKNNKQENLRIQSECKYIFNDFQKAFDSIHRDMLWNCMEESKIPEN